MEDRLVSTDMLEEKEDVAWRFSPAAAAETGGVLSCEGDIDGYRSSPLNDI